MNQIVKNVQAIMKKYKGKLDTDNKLVLMYFKEFHNLKFDGQYISTVDYLNMTVKSEDIVNAKHILKLLEECDWVFDIGNLIFMVGLLVWILTVVDFIDYSKMNKKQVRNMSLGYAITFIGAIVMLISFFWHR